jgi:hypothetical protein
MSSPDLHPDVERDEIAEALRDAGRALGLSEPAAQRMAARYDPSPFDALVGERAELYEGFGSSTERAQRRATAEVLTEHGWPSVEHARSALREPAYSQPQPATALPPAPLLSEAHTAAYLEAGGIPQAEAQRLAAQIEQRAREAGARAEALARHGPTPTPASRRVELREARR